MKAKLIILVIWIGLMVWYGYDVYTIQKENAVIQLQRLNAVDQE